MAEGYGGTQLLTSWKIGSTDIGRGQRETRYIFPGHVPSALSPPSRPHLLISTPSNDAIMLGIHQGMNLSLKSEC
jgi:hypothetical protein